MLTCPLRNTFLIKDRLNKCSRASVKHSCSALPQMSAAERGHRTGCQQHAFVTGQNVVTEGTALLPFGFCANFKKI